MMLRKFFGLTSRAVLQQVRRELGPDAMIVANRPVADGIEITAVAGDSMQAMFNDDAAATATATVANAAAVASAAATANAAAINNANTFAVTQTAASATGSAHAASAGAAAATGHTVASASAPASRADASAAWTPRRVDPADVTWPPRVEGAVTMQTPRREPLDARPPATSGGGTVGDFPATRPTRAPTPPTMTRRVDRDDAAGDATVAPTANERAVLAVPMISGDNGASARLSDEVAALRGMLEGQLAQLTWNDTLRRRPLRAQFTRDLLAAGYSASLARELIARLPDDYTPARALQWLVAVIARNLECADADDDLVARGGVYALVGPTGVGKTTTVAKLAARAAVRHGAASVALLTTDSYRVGAHDQLRIYAKILGLTTHVVSDPAYLGQLLSSLATKHLVLIDTVGMGQRDERVPEQAALLAHPAVRRVLVLNATALGETLDEVVGVYGDHGGGEAPAHAIVTKLDETARPGQVLDVAIRHRLALQYVSNGQRVPEDLHVPNATYLIHRSFKAAPAKATPSPFTLLPEEYGLLLAGAANAGGERAGESPGRDGSARTHEGSPRELAGSDHG